MFKLVRQFFSFGLVGIVGLIVDTATVYATRGWLGLYGSGLLAYLIAATSNWLLNRWFTFRNQANDRPLHHQWAMFLAANSVGFVLNRGTFFLLVTVWPLAAQQPVLATSAGAIAGLFVNFAASRRFVFSGS